MEKVKNIKPLLLLYVIFTVCGLIRTDETFSLENYLGSDESESDAFGPSTTTTTVPSAHQPQVIINVNDVVNFLHSLRKSQDDVVKRIERLARSVEFTGQEEVSKTSTMEKRISQLESRFLKLDTSVSERIENAIKSKCHCPSLSVERNPVVLPSSFEDDEGNTMYQEFEEDSDLISEQARSVPPPTIPTTTTTTPTTPKANNEHKTTGYVPRYPLPIEQPFTPPPLFSFPANTRNPRDLISASYSTGRKQYQQSPSYNWMGGSGSGPGDQGYRSNIVSPHSSAIGQHQDEIRIVIRRIDDVERSLEEMRVSQNFRRPGNVSSLSPHDELNLLREKQNVLQRSVDTVMMHFVQVARNLEKIEDKLKAERRNLGNAVSGDLPPNPDSADDKHSLGHRLQGNFDMSNPNENVVGNNGKRNSFARFHSNVSNGNDTFPLTAGPSAQEQHGSEDWYYQQSEETSSNNADLGNDERTPYAFLLPPQRDLKSLDASETDEISGQRVKRDLTILVKTVKNLTEQLGKQRNKIDKLSSELAMVNISHILILRSLDDEALQKTIRPKDCSEIKIIQLMGVTRKGYGSGTKEGDHSGLRKHKIFPQNGNESIDVSDQFEFGKNLMDDINKVLCDMETDGGGWSVIQRRGKNAKGIKKQAREGFYRNWTEYEDGFGTVEGDFWLGLSNIAAMTKLDDQELRIELTKWNGEKGLASYKFFRVQNATDLYKLSLSQYNGNVGDSLSRHVGMAFSTFDQDNDGDPRRNCAEMWKGAWWYYACHESNLNGQYAKGESGSHDFGTGIIWGNWTGNYYSLKKVVMKVRDRFIGKL